MIKRSLVDRIFHYMWDLGLIGISPLFYRPYSGPTVDWGDSFITVSPCKVTVGVNLNGHHGSFDLQIKKGIVLKAAAGRNDDIRFECLPAASKQFEAEYLPYGLRTAPEFVGYTLSVLKDCIGDELERVSQ